MTEKLKITMTYDNGSKRTAVYKGEPVALNDDTQDWLKGALIGFGFAASTVDAFFNISTDESSHG